MKLKINSIEIINTITEISNVRIIEKYSYKVNYTAYPEDDEFPINGEHLSEEKMTIKELKQKILELLPIIE